jgi:3-dehydroquinate synthase
MKRVTLRLQKKDHEILIGENLLASSSLRPYFKKGQSGSKAFVFYDNRIPVPAKKLAFTLKKSGFEAVLLPVKASESLKVFKKLYPLYGELLRKGAGRDALICAVGGGTVGDAIGFLASTYLRGLPWVSVPTTLLAQVDSGIGGKTGINHEAGKNLIGTFHQPFLVLADTSVLRGLSQRDLVSGLGEILKYGLIYDKKFFNDVFNKGSLVLKADPKVLAMAVAQCALFKARVVEKDERDLKGFREALNFGHSFAHALEASCGYGYFRHGEAVLWGMRFAARLSHHRGFLGRKDFVQIEKYLATFEVPPLPKTLSDQKLLEKIRYDKKNKGGKIRFVLLKGIGRTITVPVEFRDLEKVLRELRESVREN